MASNYDSVDLDFTYDGDLILGFDGDLQDTSRDLLLSIQNEIQSIAKSALTDWREDPNIGADLDDFVGEPNNRATAEDMQARMESALSIVVNVSDLSVRITPVHIHRVLVMVSLQVLATPGNRLTAGASISFSFLFDYMETGVYVDLDTMNHFSERGI